MKTLQIVGLVAFFWVAGASGLVADEEVEIRSRIVAYQNAWNAGEANALAAFYDEQADRANNSGKLFRRRAEIREHYRKVFAQSPPSGEERKLTYHDITVRLVSADAAVVDVDYEVSGIRAAIGFPVQGRNTVFMINRDGTWMRAAHRNSIPLSPDCLKLCAANSFLPKQ